MSLLKCERCHDVFPIEHFPNLTKGAICRSCTTGIESKKADELIKAKAKNLASEMASLTSSELEADIGRVRTILHDIYHSFGGTTSFANHIHWIIMELSNRKPLPPSVGQLMLNLMKLHHEVEKAEEQVAAREMTDEQLRRETELATVQMFVDSAGDPQKRQMLEAVLGKHGLKIEEMSPEILISQVANEDLP